MSGTRDQWQALMPILQAFVAGEPVQKFDYGGKWSDTDEIHSVMHGGRYRLKPATSVAGVGVRCAVPERAAVDALMKRCQLGVGGRHALDNAHSIMADCYGTLGALMLTVERYAASLEWIEGATAATPGLTEAELGRVLATIGRKAGGELRAHNAKLTGPQGR